MLSFSLQVVSNSLWSMDCSTPGFPVHHQLQECTQTYAHRVGDATQPSHPLQSPSLIFDLSQHHCIFQRVSSCNGYQAYFSTCSIFSRYHPYVSLQRQGTETNHMENTEYDFLPQTLPNVQATLPFSAHLIPTWPPTTKTLNNTFGNSGLPKGIWKHLRRKMLCGKGGDLEFLHVLKYFLSSYVFSLYFFVCFISEYS